jgi:uncharacterized protein YkwD
VARLPFTSLPARVACLCAVAAVGMLPASAAADSCPNANLTPQVANLGLIRTAVLCLINQERESHGESALQPNSRLARAAQGHSSDMAEEDYFSHVAPNGETPLERIRASGYLSNPLDGYVVGENIAWGTLWLATPRAIVEAWMASPGHRANILDASFRDTGVGVSPHAPASLAEGQAGALYTQDFGVVVAPGHASRRSPGDSTESASGSTGRDSAGGSGGGHRTHRRHKHRHHRRRKHHRRKRRAHRRHTHSRRPS